MKKTEAHDVSGRSVLVTGAGRGLGRALVLRLLEAGASVTGCARDPASLHSLRRDADGSDRLLLERADVADAPAMERLVESAVGRFGSLHGLVLNASILDARVPLREAAADEFRRVVDVNLNGAFNACRAAVPAMRRSGGGSIVAVSSGAAEAPRAGWGAYAVSKHALEALALNLALEEREAGVRVNIVDPGAMRTDMRRAAYPAEDPDTLPDPSAHLDVYLWLLSTASAVTGERFVAREWRSAGR